MGHLDAYGTRLGGSFDEEAEVEHLARARDRGVDGADVVHVRADRPRWPSRARRRGRPRGRSRRAAELRRVGRRADLRRLVATLADEPNLEDGAVKGWQLGLLQCGEECASGPGGAVCTAVHSMSVLDAWRTRVRGGVEAVGVSRHRSRWKRRRAGPHGESPARWSVDGVVSDRSRSHLPQVVDLSGRIQPNPQSNPRSASDVNPRSAITR